MAFTCNREKVIAKLFCASHTQSFGISLLTPLQKQYEGSLDSGLCHHSYLELHRQDSQIKRTSLPDPSLQTNFSFQKIIVSKKSKKSNFHRKNIDENLASTEISSMFFQIHFYCRKLNVKHGMASQKRESLFPQRLFDSSHVFITLLKTRRPGSSTPRSVFLKLTSTILHSICR